MDGATSRVRMLQWRAMTDRQPTAERQPPSATRRFALLGWPLPHSLSPAIQGAAFASLGLDATYELLPVEEADLPATLETLRAGALSGANVTVPHKIAVRSMLDTESDTVARLGAVNTILRTEAGLEGHNTDGEGMRFALADVGFPRPGGPAKAVVIGAGGAARAIVDVLLGAGSEVVVLSRRVTEGALLVRHLFPSHPVATVANAPLDPATARRVRDGADLVVNATPVGSGHDPTGSPWPEQVPLPDGAAVIDIVAWPPETPFVQRARDEGILAVGGISMLVGQAVAAVRLWTGRDPRRRAMCDAARRACADAGFPLASSEEPCRFAS
jgi:shikimate dehydrogenase